MRIISGRFKGRQIHLPKRSCARPTSDRVREAMFSVISSSFELENADVLDLYAGSGALGLEALSRGARSAVFVEQSRELAGRLEGVLEEFGVSQDSQVVCADVKKFLKMSGENSQGSASKSAFNLVFADPPYAQHPGGRLFNYLFDSGLAKAGALVVVESNTELSLEELTEGGRESPSLRLQSDKTYGDTAVRFFFIE